MSLAKATSTIHDDNGQVRVTEWRFPPESETGHHVHEMDYVIVPVMGGRLRMVDDDGTANDAELVAGRSYFRKAGVSHNVINPGPGEVVFVEVELKG